MTKLLLLLLALIVVNPAFAKHHYHTKKYAHKHAKGLKRHHEKHKKFMQGAKRVSYLKEATPIPGKIDISSMVSLPENQGQCGSCWDFSLTKALRSAWMVAGTDPGVLEFNYLLNNCGPGPSQYGCNGGDFNAAVSFENGAGPGLNANNPYTMREGRCADLPVAASAVSYAMLGDNSGPTFKDLAYAIAVNHHMVSVDVAAASGDWESYSDGVYDGCTGGANRIDHMIDAVGFDCRTSIDSSGHCVFDSMGRAANHDEVLLLQNNWGEQWGVAAENGHAGYMWSLMYGEDGRKCNAIANDALEFTVSVPAPQPTPTPTPTPPSPPQPEPPHHCEGFLCSIACWPWCK